MNISGENRTERTMKMKASRNFRYLEKYRVFSLRDNFIQIYKMRLKNYTLLM